MIVRAGTYRLVVGLILVVAAVSVSGEEVRSTLQSYDARIEVLGQSMSASMCRLALPDASWRVAFSSEAQNWRDLIEEQGEGWTIITGGNSQFWLNRWRGPSRRLEAEHARFMALLAVQLGDPSAAPMRVELSRNDPEILLESANSEAQGAEEPGCSLALGDRLATRAMGRGGELESWWMTWHDVEGPSGDRELVIRSRRRPGALHLVLVEEVDVAVDDKEILMPIWPLVELMRVEGLH